MKALTQRQEDALARHKKKGTHTKKHMEEMKKLMLRGKTFTEAHKMTMKRWENNATQERSQFICRKRRKV